MEGSAAARVLFWFETRLFFSHTARAMKTAKATTEATPAMMGVESEPEFCSAEVVVEEILTEGAGVGAVELAPGDAPDTVAVAR